MAACSSVCVLRCRHIGGTEQLHTLPICSGSLPRLQGGDCQSRTGQNVKRKRGRLRALCGPPTPPSPSDCVLPSITAQLILGSPLKGITPPDVKYTLCVERLIKYWLQTYMNLPHQIEAPVGGGRLWLRCLWCGNEQRGGRLALYSFPVLLIYLFCCRVVSSALWGVSAPPQIKLRLHTSTDCD